MMKTSEVLAKAADLIEPEGCWAQGGSAKNAAGQWLGAGGAASKNAVCWCAIGALLHSGMSSDSTFAMDYMRQVIGYPNGVGLWNDAPERTQAEVVAALRQAAVLARGEGQ